MKKTMYELLGMVKDGKAPKKIKYNKNGFVDFYKGELYERLRNEDNFLNDEVEILEEPKVIPEKLELKYDDIIYGNDFKKQILMYCDNLQYKINEILDFLKSKGE